MLIDQPAAATVYDTGFFDDQSQGSLRSAGEVVPVLVSLMQPRSVVDVGCGVGAWLSVFREHGVEDVLGIDGDYVDRSRLRIPEANFFPRDLTRSIGLDRRFDMVVSLEVAEHLPARNAASFVDSLVSLGDVVVFSAAIPRQGGTHHVNEQWPDYWQALFQSRRYVLIDCLRRRFWDNEAIASCYRQNAFVYLNESLKDQYAGLIAEDSRLPLRLVHPDVFNHVLSRRPTLRPLVRALPSAIALAVRTRVARLRRGRE